MPADQFLTTVLRAFQEAPDPDQLSKTLSRTTSLLTTLSNPLNVTLLTSHILTAPAIWRRADGLRTSLRIISIFNTAAMTVRKHEFEGQSKPHDAYQPRQGGGIGCDDWATAAVKGLDDRSPRWQHLLVLGGVLLGMEGQQRHGLSRGLRTTLERAIVTAANLALENPTSGGLLGANSIILALNHAFPLLSHSIRRELDYDALVMIMVRAMTSADGYQDGQFLEEIDYDVVPVPGNKLDWSAKAPSFLGLKMLALKPLISSMGPLARLIAHAIENMTSSIRAMEVIEHLSTFTNSFLERWKQNKLSEIDPSEESSFLTSDTIRITNPVLWQILKTTMFATVVILQAVMGRTLIDHVLSAPLRAPSIATQTLLILKNIHFISSRLGLNAFSAYTFVNLTSIDILTRYSASSLSFLRAIYPAQAGQIPNHPLQRNHDLFYLNTAEHFTLSLSLVDAEFLISTPCTPYLNPSANEDLRDIFEAAHSAMLSVLAAPQNAVLTSRIIPSYVESLFASFPKNLSPRQFRFAFKALMQIATPPNPLSRSHPMMAETLLELLHYRALNASGAYLPLSMAIKSEADVQTQTAPLSEQAVLLLTLLDALPNVTLTVLEGWLSMAADLLDVVKDQSMKDHCKKRFWELLESGEMDVERSALCVGWWGTRGGRERVLFGGQGVDEGPVMSGGLGDRDMSRL